VIHHPSSCPARTYAGKCICPAGKAEARALRRLDPDYPLQVLGGLFVLAFLVLGVVAVLMAAGVLEPMPWSPAAQG
jgi:hypothetical protein